MDQKISARTAATPLTGAEYLGIIQGGADRKTTTQEIADLASGTITISRSLSSAEILALFSAPIGLVSSPGPGKFLRPICATVILNYSTAPYSGNPMRFTVGSLVPITSTIYTASSDAGEMPSASGTSTTGFLDFIDAPLMLDVGIANPTAGHGTVDVYVTYITVLV